MKLFISQNKLVYTKGAFSILPKFDVWYFKDFFLETGVTSPAAGFEIGWLKWQWSFGVQQGY